MASKGQEAAQRLLAIVVIMAMLSMIGIPLTVIFFFGTVVYFVWRAVQRSEQQDVKHVFDFYISAHDILRDDEKRWYGFEIETTIKEGESLLQMMADPPPLVYYCLGALYNRAGEYEAAADHLAYVVENEQGEEARRHTASPELRRYVQVLRRIEREPAEAPLTMAAIRGLERMRRTTAERLLLESRSRLIDVDKLRSASSSSAFTHKDSQRAQTPGNGAQLHVTPPSVPPPIADVLRDVYEEEKKTA